MSGDQDMQLMAAQFWLMSDQSCGTVRIEAPPARAVTDRRSRTGATGGVSRSSNRLSTGVVLHKCC